MGKIATDRRVNKDTQNLGNQEAFLSNMNNKMTLMSLLSDYLQKNCINVRQAKDDADTLIVSVALEKASLQGSSSPVAVIAEDTDRLALLLFHRQHYMTDIFFVSEPKRGRGVKAIAGKCISI